MLLVLPMTVGGVKFISETEDKLSMYQITYLDEMSPKVTNGIGRLSTDESLILDFSQDAYVLNQYSFGMLEKKNIAQYLEDGGIIVVNDNEVTSEDLKAKVDTNVAEFDYSKEKHHYGFYLYNDGETNVTVTSLRGIIRNQILLISDAVAFCFVPIFTGQTAVTCRLYFVLLIKKHKPLTSQFTALWRSKPRNQWLLNCYIILTHRYYSTFSRFTP